MYDMLILLAYFGIGSCLACIEVWYSSTFYPGRYIKDKKNDDRIPPIAFVLLWPFMAILLVAEGIDVVGSWFFELFESKEVKERKNSYGN